MIFFLSSEVNRPEKTIDEFRSSNTSSQLNFNSKKEDENDEKLCELLSKYLSPIKFIRLKEGIYKFGTKKVIVKLLKGKVVCSVGGDFMIIEDFL